MSGGGVHQFKKKSFGTPTWCGVCNEFIWGLVQQGYSCTLCSVASHPKCRTAARACPGKSVASKKQKKGGGSPKGQDADQLRALGLDPSLFEEPDFGDEAADYETVEVDVEELMRMPGSGKKGAKKGQPMNFEDDDDDFEVELTEKDLKDPGLLSELQGLGDWGDEDMGLGKEGEEMEGIEVLEDEDGQDPELLLQLEAMEGKGQKKPSTPVATAPSPKKPEIQRAPVKPASAPSPVQSAQIAPQPAKSQGAMGVQVFPLKPSQSPVAQQSPKPVAQPTVQQGPPKPISQPVKPIAQQAPAKPVPQQAPVKPVPQQAPAKPVAQQPLVKAAPQGERPSSTSPMEQKLSAIDARAIEYKQAALAAKKEGNIDAAKKYLLKSKEIEQFKPLVQSGKPFDIKNLPPPPSSSSSPAPVKQAAPVVNLSPLELIAQTPLKIASRDQLKPSVLAASVRSYRDAALKAKKDGNLEFAQECLSIYKALEELRKSGRAIDAAHLPPSPTELAARPKVKPATSPAPQPAPSKVASPSAVPSKVVSPKVSATPPSTASPKTASPKSVSSSTSEWTEASPVENIVSNDVFEYEIEAVNKLVIAYKSKGKPIPDELTDRQQQLQLGMTMLGMKVESGQLSEDMYLNIMRKKSEEEMQLARAFLAEGKKDWAAAAVQRCKIMKAEIAATLE